MEAGGRDMLAHLAKLKPVKGWREFLGEVGIIVLGVMIALTADKVAQKINDRDTASDTRADITDEFNDGLASVALRGRAEPCIQRRLGELRALFADWSRTGTFKTPQWVAQTPALTIQLNRYEAAADAGRLTLLPSEEQFRMGAIAEGLRGFAEIQRQELVLWGRLRALQAGADILGAQERAILREVLQDASTLDYQQRLSIRELMPQARAYGFSPDFERVDRTGKDIWSNGRFSPSICTTIDTPRAEANKTQVTPLPE